MILFVLLVFQFIPNIWTDPSGRLHDVNWIPTEVYMVGGSLLNFLFVFRKRFAHKVIRFLGRVHKLDHKLSCTIFNSYYKLNGVAGNP